DLKPSNIKLTAAGQVKVLDFGLAKATDVPLDAGATQSGAILGTAAYMSPEQAKSRPVDRRSDIFAFGSVLFEMLAGRPAFRGDSIPEILATIIKDEPAWSSLPADTPEAIHRVLRRCLEKDRSRRWQSAGDIRLEVDEALAAPHRTPARPASSRWRERAIWAAVLVALLGIVVGLTRRPSSVSLPSEVRLQIPTPGTADPVSF